MIYVVNGILWAQGSSFTRIDRVTEKGAELAMLVSTASHADWIVSQLNRLCDKPGPAGLFCQAQKGHDEGEHPSQCWGSLSMPQHPDSGASAGQGAEAGVSPAQTEPVPAAPETTGGESSVNKPTDPNCACMTANQTALSYMTQQCRTCHRELLKGPTELVLAEFIKPLDVPQLIGHAKAIRACALEMKGRLAMTYDKTSVITANTDAMLKLLGQE